MTRAPAHTEELSLLGHPAPDDLDRLLGAPAVLTAGAAVTAHPGTDAVGRSRLRLRVSDPDPARVAATRDALLHEARVRGWRLFLV